MHISQIFGATKKDVPSQDFIPSLQLVIRSGMLNVLNTQKLILNSLGSVIYDKLELLFTDQLKQFQKISLIPSNIYKQDIYTNIQDEIKSYKQLPKFLQCKYNKTNNNNQLKLGMLAFKQEEIIRLVIIENEQTDIKTTLQSIVGKLNDLMEVLNIDVRITSSLQKEFFTLHLSSLDQYVICNNNDYSENIQTAISYIESKTINLVQNPMKIIDTPNTKTIAELADLLNIPKTSCAKIIFYRIDEMEKILICVIRGDLDVNEYKLMKLLNINELKVATNEEIQKIGAIPGYASPIGIDRKNSIIVVDYSIINEVNLVAGANSPGQHILNTNFGRDYDADFVTSISLVKKDHLCYNCQNPIEIVNGVKLVEVITPDFQLDYLNSKGKSSIAKIVQVDINILRILGSVFAKNYDQYGLILPKSITPFDVIILGLTQKPKNQQLIKSIYNDLLNKYSVLLDDRNIRPGKKFADADLLGIPLRIVISDITLKEETAELKLRNSKEKLLSPINDLQENIDLLLNSY